MSDFDDAMTLGEARDELRELVADGHECPCCRQFAKVYRRKLHATMVRDLLRMTARFGAGTVFHITDLGTHGGDFAKLVHWGLIAEAEPPRREDGGRAGYWTITARGDAFARGRLRVPTHVRIYAGRLLGLEGDQITAREALGARFNYAELMADAPELEHPPALELPTQEALFA